MPFHRWRSALFFLASSCFVSSQVVIQADLAWAQYPPNLPDTKKAEWPSPTLNQKFFSNANLMCEYTAGQVNDSSGQTHKKIGSLRSRSSSSNQQKYLEPETSILQGAKIFMRLP